MRKEAYEELNSRLPHIGSHVKTAEGLDAEVQSVSVLKPACEGYCFFRMTARKRCVSTVWMS